MKNPIRIYTMDEIWTVYDRFSQCGWSVVYSSDGGITWQSCPMDTGKWNSGRSDNPWVFAFLELKVDNKKL